MKRTNSIFVVLATGAISVSCAFGQGVFWIQHEGSADPTMEGFSLAYMGSQAQVGPILDDMGLDSWMTAVITANNNIIYQQDLAPDQVVALAGSDWIMSSELRVVQSSGVFGNNYVSLSTGSERFTMFIGAESDGDPFVLLGDSSVSPQYVLQGGGPGYHDYQLRYSAQTDTVDLWIDGSERLAGISAAGGTQRSLFEWGESQGGPSQANWNSITLEIVPEPSFAAIFGLGLAACCFMVCRRYSEKALRSKESDA